MKRCCMVCSMSSSCKIKSTHSSTPPSILHEIHTYMYHVHVPEMASHVLHVPGTMMVVDFGIHVCRTQEQVHQGYTLKDI